MTDQLPVTKSSDLGVIFDSLDTLIRNKETDGLRDALSGEDVQSQMNENVAQFIHWACAWIEKLSNNLDEDILSILHVLLQSMPLQFEVGECLLLLTGQLTQLRTNANVRYLLKPLANCITLTDYTKFARVRPVINEITASLMHQSRVHLEQPKLSKLPKVLEAVIDFYSNVLVNYRFREGHDEGDAFFTANLLFLFAEPLLVLDYTSEFELLFSHSLRLINQSKTTPYALLAKAARLSEHGNERNSEASAENYPCLIFTSLLGILSYVMLHATPKELHNCWPLVFSKAHYINLVHPILNYTLTVRSYPNLKNTEHEKMNALKSPPEVIQKKTISRSLELLQAILHFCLIPLNSTWWSEDHMDYVWLLKKLAIQPISGEMLPEVVTDSISMIDRLFGMSTYSARYRLFCRILDPRQPGEHHGWRGHMITLCKDYLHQAWLECLNAGPTVVASRECEAGEETPCLPFEQRCLGQLAELIFVYPLPSSTDALVDQSSWILAALNMALYILLRCNTICMNRDLFPTSGVTPDVGLAPYRALLRQTNSNSRFDDFFLKPLEKDLNCQITEIQARIHAFEMSLKSAANSSEKNRLNTELTIQRSTLLRLRLLQVTLEHVQKAHRDLCSKVIL
ncbi:hypothetical protein CSKR_113852 [Clonorchis sinensis]|uniref:Uncharacterized protein n=2 Tax=Clonorchis sinensis TaxID=79923 RepID=H2KQP7_CLOSI|nr:hypothetical protein CSKR_113852 [Clonorchis sinensis]GAA29213.1 hypothetical protein CLF_104409 [Clonorchis sinensis]